MFVQNRRIKGMGSELGGTHITALRDLTVPAELDRIKKCVQTQNFRLIMTEKHELFFQGQNTQFLFGFGLPENQQKNGFMKLPL